MDARRALNAATRAAALAALAAPAPAAAQGIPGPGDHESVPGLYANAEPEPPRGGPPFTPPPPFLRAPGRPGGPGPEAGLGEVRNYRGDAGRTSVEPDAAVSGPLEHLWTARFEGVPNHPLIVGGRLVASVTTVASADYAPVVVAWDLRTRRELWRRVVEVGHAPDGIYTGSVHIATDGERVFASGRSDGVLRAYALADGAPLWRQEPYGGFYGSEPPIVAGGLVLWVHRSTIFAHDPATGEERWRFVTRLDYTTEIAADAERVYATNVCGETVAVGLRDGKEVWRGEKGDCDIGRPAAMAVSGGRVIAGLGRVYDAATGALVGRHTLDDQASVADGVAFSNGSAPKAVDLVAGAERWVQGAGRADWNTQIPPAVSGGTVFVTRAGRIFGLDRNTGAVLSEVFVPYGPASTWDQGGIGGIAIGHGVLAVTTMDGISVWTGLLRPQPRGTDIAATRFEVLLGRRTQLAAGVGSGLEGAPIELQEDRFPYGRRWRTIARGAHRADRTFTAEVRPSRNTRYRLVAPGAGPTPPLVVRSRPRVRVSSRSIRTSVAILRADVTGPSDMRLAGRRFELYQSDVARDRADLIAGGRLRRLGRNRYVAQFRYRWPSAGTDDGPLFCIRGLPRIGFGRDGPFERRCGARRIRVPLEPAPDD